MRLTTEAGAVTVGVEVLSTSQPPTPRKDAHCTEPTQESENVQACPGVVSVDFRRVFVVALGWSHCSLPHLAGALTEGSYYCC